MLLIALGVGLLVLAQGRQQGPPDHVAGRARPADSPGSREVLAAEVLAPGSGGAPGAHPATGVPTALALPSLEVEAPVVEVTMTPDSVLWPPDDPRVLGWWSTGARPGAVTGSALVVGHSVSTGGGAFDELDTLEVGDPVRVRTTEGVLRYATTSVRTYRKNSLARAAGRLFSQEVPGRLVLVTCEDWDGETWLSNAVVLAEPVREAPAR